MRITRAVCAAYVVACTGALFLILAGALGWLGREPGSVAGVFAQLLGLPWSLLAAQVANAGVVGRIVLVAATMALNLAIIFSIGRWLARRA